MVMVMMHGQVQVVAFALATLPAYLKCQTMDDVCKGLATLNADEVDGISKVSPGYACTIEAGDVFHVPAGWLLCKRCSQGALIYGVRKSWVPKSVDLRVQYKFTIDLLKKSGRNTDKLQEVLIFMERS